MLVQVSWHCAILGRYLVRNGEFAPRCNFVVLGFRGMGQKQIKNPKAINQTANQTRVLRCGTGRNQGAEDEDRMFSPFLHPKTSTFKHSSFTRLLHHPHPPPTSYKLATPKTRHLYNNHFVLMESDGTTAKKTMNI